MARSHAIWVVECYSTICAFTVKHELVSFLETIDESLRSKYRISRFIDGSRSIHDKKNVSLEELGFDPPEPIEGF